MFISNLALTSCLSSIKIFVADRVLNTRALHWCTRTKRDARQRLVHTLSDPLRIGYCIQTFFLEGEVSEIFSINFNISINALLCRADILSVF